MRVELRDGVVDSLRPLADLVRVYAPMLPHPLEVNVDGEVTAIPAGWRTNWMPRCSTSGPSRPSTLCSEIERAGTDRPLTRSGGTSAGDFEPVGGSTRIVSRSWTKCRPEFQEGGVRLLAAFEGFTLLSLRGLAIQPIATPGFVGVIDLESATPDVSRHHAISADVSDVLERANEATRPQVVENLNALGREGLLLDKLDLRHV